MQILVLGAGGKLATLLRAAWPKDAAVEPIWYGADHKIELRESSAALTDAMNAADAVLNLAGVTRETSTRSFDDNPAIARTLLLAANGKHVFLCSSAAIYGDQKSLCDENMKPTPLSAYGRSKVQMERVAKNFSNATCMRIGNVAGCDALLGQDRSHYQLDQFANGNYPSRSYIGPHHLALIVQKLALLSVRGTSLPKCLNVAARVPISMDALLKAAGKTWTPVPASEKAIEQVHLDTSLLNNLIETESPYASIIEDLRAIEG